MRAESILYRNRNHELVHAVSGVAETKVREQPANVAFFDLGSRAVAGYSNVPRRVGSRRLMNDAKSEEDSWWVVGSSQSHMATGNRTPPDFSGAHQ